MYLLVALCRFFFVFLLFFFVFENQINGASGWCGISMLLNFSMSEAFAEEDLILGETSFSPVFGMDIGYHPFKL